MTSRMLTIAFLVLTSATAFAADDPKAPPPKPCTFTVTVDAPAQWITILPERQPPTRSRLSFDSQNGNVDVEWDPYDGRGLLRRVVLRKGTWQVSFWSEPQRDSMNFARNYAWQPKPQATCPASPFSGKATFVLTELDGETPQDVTLTLEAVVKQALGATRGAEGTVTTTVTPGNLMRSFDVADVPARLAESAIRVIVQRVERKALRLVTQRLRTVVCQRRKDDAKLALLPSTCLMFDALDLRSLPSVASHFASALASDLFAVTARTITVDATTQILVTRIFDIAVKVAELLRRPEAVVDDVQARFLAMAEATFSTELDPKAMCGARLALTMIAQCQSSSQCTASFLRDVISSPSVYFDTQACGVDFKPAEATIRRIEAIIADGRAVFDVARTVVSLDRARALLRANLRIIETVVCDAAPAACDQATRLTQIGVALADGDLPAVIATAEPVLLAYATDWEERQRKLMSMFLMFVREGLPLASKDPEDAKLAQARLERSFDLFLDGAAQRDGRDGSTIVSLATSLRATAGIGFDGEFKGPVSLPLGIAVDVLGKQAADNRGKTSGIHLELNAIDLGNYLRLDNDGEPEKPRWSDLASLSAGVGYFWGDHDMPFSVTLTGGVAPGAEVEMDVSERRWVGFAALHFGVYVPLIDLN